MSTSRYVGHKLADKKVRAAEAVLGDGEVLHAVVNANKLKPMVDVVGLTNLRIFAGEVRSLATDGPKIEIQANIIASFDITGRMKYMKVGTKAGDTIDLGSMTKEEDREPLLAVARHLTEHPPSDAALQVLHPPTPAAEVEEVEAAAGETSEGATAEVEAARDLEGWPSAARAVLPTTLQYLAQAEQANARRQHDQAETFLEGARNSLKQVGMRSRKDASAALDSAIRQRYRDGRLADPVAWRLDAASDFARAGDIKREERMITEAREAALRQGDSKKKQALKDFDGLVSARVGRKELRIGARHVLSIGRVEQWGDKPGALLLGAMLSLDDVEVYSDRILRDGVGYKLDGTEAVSLEVDGQVTTSSRPTLSRMAAGSVLPGSALLPGMAMQQQKTTDTRSARLVVAHAEWMLQVGINPEYVAQVRPKVAQLAAVVRALESANIAKGPGGRSDAAGRLDQLERLAQLVAAGAVSPEEAKQLRAEILAT